MTMINTSIALTFLGWRLYAQVAYQGYFTPYNGNERFVHEYAGAFLSFFLSLLLFRD